jgi:hypothetical protein
LQTRLTEKQPSIGITRVCGYFRTRYLPPPPSHKARRSSAGALLNVSPPLPPPNDQPIAYHRRRSGSRTETPPPPLKKRRSRPKGSCLPPRPKAAKAKKPHKKGLHRRRISPRRCGPGRRTLCTTSTTKKTGKKMARGCTQLLAGAPGDQKGLRTYPKKRPPHGNRPDFMPCFYFLAARN